jgi:serpin B
MAERKNGWVAAVVALVLGVASACQASSDDGLPDSSSDSPAPSWDEARSALVFDDTPEVDEAALHEMSAGQIALAADLLALGPAGANQALSPVSISIAFAMLSAGAGGNTLAEVERVLHFPPQELLHPAMNALLAALGGRDVAASAENDGVLLRPVNQIFQERTFSVESAFLDTLALRYDAGVYLVDFVGEPETSRLAINDWVLAQTSDRIRDLLPGGSIDALTRLVLVNALYLRAAWAAAFREEDTADGVFHAPGGDVTVPFLRGEIATARYARVGSIDLIELPFAGDALTFTMIVPREGAVVDLVALAPQFDALLGGGLQVEMPRFRVTMSLDLKDALQHLGVADLFESPACDLTGINPDAQLFVSGAFHQTFVDVNERGVEAAAATAIVIGDEFGPMRVVVDEPFYFLMRDRATGAPLFVGHVSDPSS